MNRSARRIEATLDEAISKLAGADAFDLKDLGQITPPKALQDLWPHITYGGRKLLPKLMKMDDRGIRFIEDELGEDFVGELHECYLGYSPRFNEFVVGYNGTYNIDPPWSDQYQAGTIVVFNDSWQPDRMSRERGGNFYRTMYGKLKQKFPDIIDLRLS